MSWNWLGGLLRATRRDTASRTLRTVAVKLGLRFTTTPVPEVRALSVGKVAGRAIRVEVRDGITVTTDAPAGLVVRAGRGEFGLRAFDAQLAVSGEHDLALAMLHTRVREALLALNGAGKLLLQGGRLRVWLPRSADVDTVVGVVEHAAEVGAQLADWVSVPLGLYRGTGPSETEPSIRLLRLEALERREHGFAERVITEGLTDEEPWWRTAVALHVGRYDVLIAGLDGEPEMAAACLQALCQDGEDHLPRDKVRSLLETATDPGLIHAAVVALGEVGVPSDLPLLAQFLEHPTAGKAARRAVQSLRGSERAAVGGVSIAELAPQAGALSEVGDGGGGLSET
jgi:hypothetical protein